MLNRSKIFAAAWKAARITAAAYRTAAREEFPAAIRLQYRVLRERAEQSARVRGALMPTFGGCPARHKPGRFDNANAFGGL